MSKLTKSEIKLHNECLSILAKDTLTDDEKEFILSHYNESATNINSELGAYFTPLALAWDFSLEVGRGDVIDLCAGIGTLAYTVWHRNRHRYDEDSRPRFVCIERNPEYVDIGRKILPEAEWVCADVFNLPEDIGLFDWAISNPPFGRSKNDLMPLQGVSTELNVLYVASKLAPDGAFILPQMSCPFEYSGVQCYRRRESSAFEQFYRQTGIDLEAGIGIDCAYHRDQWKFAPPSIEIALYDMENWTEPKPEEKRTVIKAKRAGVARISDDTDLDIFD